ncbi:MAG TPA: hypothetical protein VEH04_03195 [Verrucomicrobiae bacterium]|nr:hypothetical protein [Verrucomicrobiae bacterium]
MNLHCFRSLLLATLFLFLLSQEAAEAQSRAIPRLRPLDLITNDVPKSVFTIPSPESQARDPFFPESVRLKPGTKTSAPRPAIKLLYNGLSGTAEKPLAIINGRTLAPGESTELRAGAARATLRCVSIQGETVVVEIDGRQMTLRLGDKK